MSTPFNPLTGLIVIEAVLEGPTGAFTLSLVLDTGARATVIRDSVLVQAGYAPALVTHTVRMTTASSIVQVPRLPVIRLTSLGQNRLGFLVVAHTPPPTFAFDGLLGLDFLRGQTLNIDFRTGQIDLH